MSEKDDPDNKPADGAASGGEGGQDDESSLPEDAKRLLKFMGATVRREVDSVLDERLRVQQGDGGGEKDANAEGESGQEPPKPQSFIERIGF